MSIPDQNQLQQPQNPSTYQQVRPLDFYALGKMSNPPKSNELYDSHTSYPGQSLDLLHRNYFSIRNQNYDIYRDNYKKLATLKDKIESDAKISYQQFQHPTNLQNKETYNLTKERLFATDRYSTIRPGQNISRSDFINQKSNFLNENKPQISKWENPNETGDKQSKLLKDNRLVFVGSNIPKVEFEMPDANSRTKVSNDAPEWFEVCPDWKIKKFNEEIAKKNDTLSVFSRYQNWITVTPKNRDRRHALEKKKITHMDETSSIMPKWMESQFKGKLPENMKRVEYYPIKQKAKGMMVWVDKDINEKSNTNPEKSIFSFMDFRNNVVTKKEAEYYGSLVPQVPKKFFDWDDGKRYNPKYKKDV